MVTSDWRATVGRFRVYESGAFLSQFSRSKQAVTGYRLVWMNFYLLATLLRDAKYQTFLSRPIW
jgi:hypothetical protein